MSIQQRPTIDISGFDLDLTEIAFLSSSQFSPSAYWNNYLDRFNREINTKILGYTEAETTTTALTICTQNALKLPLMYNIWGLRATYEADISYKKKDGSVFTDKIRILEAAIGIQRVVSRNAPKSTLTPGRISRSSIVTVMDYIKVKKTDNSGTWPLLARILNATKEQAHYITFDAMYAIGEGELTISIKIADLLLAITKFEYIKNARIANNQQTKDNNSYKFPLTANITYIIGARQSSIDASAVDLYLKGVNNFFEGLTIYRAWQIFNTYSYKDSSKISTYTAYTSTTADNASGSKVDAEVINWRTYNVSTIDTTVKF